MKIRKGGPSDYKEGVKQFWLKPIFDDVQSLVSFSHQTSTRSNKTNGCKLINPDDFFIVDVLYCVDACTLKRLREELTRALIEAKDGSTREGGIEGSLEPFNELVKEMTSKRQDIKAFAFKTKAMVNCHIFICTSLYLLLHVSFSFSEIFYLLLFFCHFRLLVSIAYWVDIGKLKFASAGKADQNLLSR